MVSGYVPKNKVWMDRYDMGRTLFVGLLAET